MLDKIINEVMNPAYETLNAVEGFMNSKWAILSHIDKTFTENGWKLDPGTYRQAIASLKKSQAKNYTGIFPKMLVGTPDGDWIDFSIQFDRKTSVLNNRVKFEIIYPNKKKKVGYVPSLRTLTISSFADSFFQQINMLYKGTDTTSIEKDLGFDYSAVYTDMERLNRLFPGINIDYKAGNNSVSLIFTFTDESKNQRKKFKYLNYAGEEQEEIDGDLFNSILDEIGFIADNYNNGNGMSIIDKMRENVRNYESKYMFYNPEQKTNFLKFLNIVLSDRVFDNLFKQGLIKSKVSDLEISYDKESQEISMYCSRYSGNKSFKDMDEFKRIAKDSISRNIVKYATKNKSANVSGDELKKKYILKMIFLLKGIDHPDVKNNMRDLIFLIKQI